MVMGKAGTRNWIQRCKKTAVASTVPHSQSSSSCSKQAIQAIPVRLEYCFPSAEIKLIYAFIFNIDSEHSLLFYCLRLSSWDKQTAFMRTVQKSSWCSSTHAWGQILVYAGWGWWHLPRRFHLKLGNGWEALFPAGVPFYWEMLWAAVGDSLTGLRVTPRRKIFVPLSAWELWTLGLFPPISSGEKP